MSTAAQLYPYLSTDEDFTAFGLYCVSIGIPQPPEGPLTPAQQIIWDRWKRHTKNVLKEIDHNGKGGTLRMPLSAIKGIGDGASRAIVEEREKNGTYRSLEDFIERLPDEAATTKILTQLAKAGAMDCFGVKREDICENVKMLLNWRTERRRNKLSGMRSIFD
jgi:DNA polymerase III alpha subunit